MKTVVVLSFIFNVHRLSALLNSSVNSSPHSNRETHRRSSDVGENSQYSSFVYRIKADSSLYTGLLLSDRIALTDRSVEGAETVQLCNFVREVCQMTFGVIKTNFEFILLKVMMDSMGDEIQNNTYKGDFRLGTNCVSVGYGHDPIDVDVNGPHVTCRGACAHLDGIFCDYRIVGALYVHPQYKNVFPIEKLIKYALEASGSAPIQKDIEEFEKEIESEDNIEVRKSDAVRLSVFAFEEKDIILQAMTPFILVKFLIEI